MTEPKSKLKDKYLILILVFLCSTFVAYFNLIDTRQLREFFLKKSYKPAYNKVKNTEINFIYVGSSKCIFSNNREVASIVDLSISKIKSLSDSLEMGFSAIGIAAEWDVKAGINHLQDVANFNEISVGNNWGNNLIEKYIGDLNNEASTPQILITVKKYSQTTLQNIDEEFEILNITGMDNIKRWYSEGNLLNIDINED